MEDKPQLMNLLKRCLTKRILKKHPISYCIWHDATKPLPLVQLLSNKERTRLRLLTSLFLAKKRFNGAHGLIVTNEISLTIATQACLLILHLGIDSYDGWKEIIVYPGPFLVQHKEADDTGVVHNNAHGVSGESWSRGPVILSWQDVEHDSYQIHSGHHVVIHEFAHKLDMQTGWANGLPPLHPDMTIEKWNQVLTDAWEALQDTLSQRRHSYINAYAAVSPAEFFAVISEYFFTAPTILKHHAPAVFQQLQAYYRQHPANPT